MSQVTSMNLAVEKDRDPKFKVMWNNPPIAHRLYPVKILNLLSGPHTWPLLRPGSAPLREVPMTTKRTALSGQKWYNICLKTGFHRTCWTSSRACSHISFQNIGRVVLCLRVDRVSRLEATEDLAKDNLPRWCAHVLFRNGVWSLACS